MSAENLSQIAKYLLAFKTLPDLHQPPLSYPCVIYLTFMMTVHSAFSFDHLTSLLVYVQYPQSKAYDYTVQHRPKLEKLLVTANGGIF